MYAPRVIAVIAMLVLTGCGGGSADVPSAYGATTARIGESQTLLGWNVAVANLRFEADHALVDIDASPADPGSAHAAPQDLRFGLYGALLHPIERTGVGSCDEVLGAAPLPLTVQDPDRLSGTVCLGPIRDQAQVRGVYAYSAADRIPGTTAAYAAAFPVGLPETNPADTGLKVSTTSVEAWRADGVPLTAQSLGDPTAFTGNGYMLLGLQIDAVAQQYRDDSAARGGPMMVVVAPTRPPPGINPACSAYGASLLVLPDASLNSVHLNASLCTQGEINQALLYATVSAVGTHAAVWTE
ncbi:hypothetical protein MMUR_15160 [Mycolicibacterium murale]|uniref:Lipoprotein n=2 Tax=Mycolicibacterium murale TaxID=182220 RepID=A0A7I9WJ61_9MYCO|nr:hypothetical protein MMUR_15160 [Mycolicibacterium murale]